MILDIVKKYVREEDIIFIVSNFGDNTSNSSDVDIYCVTTGRSSVHLFNDENGIWTEVFIDKLSDVYKKIANMDEIAINFIREMSFIYGDNKLFNKLKSMVDECVLNYQIPDTRKRLIKYRVKVLLSKYLNQDRESTSLQGQFILNSLTYPLVQLILEYHNIFPSSPKRWILQLESGLSNKEFGLVGDFINGKLKPMSIIDLCSRYVGDIHAIDIEKTNNNSTTSLS